MKKEKTPLEYFTKKQKPFADTLIDYLGNNRDHDSGIYNNLISQTGPVIPFIPFSFNMNFDLVLAVSDDQYSMYEIIRVDLPDSNSLWFTLDSKFDGSQFIGLPKNEKQKKIVHQMASLLGVQTYEANLTVKSSIDTENNKELLIKYNRVDPEKQVEPKVIELAVTIPQAANIDSDKAAKSIIPTINKRLSHGMNHSASNFLALIDIHKSLPLHLMTKLKVNVKSNNIKFQSILGVKVKSLISQLVSGIGKNNYNTQSLKLKKVEESDSSVTFTIERGILDDSIILQKIFYKFYKKDNKYELKDIFIEGAQSGERLTQFSFNPPLPDLRYRINRSVKGLVAAEMNGREGLQKQNGLVSYVSSYRIENSPNAKGILVELNPGDDRLNFRQKFLKTPSWIYNRAIIIDIHQVENDLNVQTNIMSPQKSLDSITEQNYQAERVSASTSLSKFHIKWSKRPHRLSRIVVRSEQNKQNEMKVENIPFYENRDDVAYLLGGTWGNGESSTDTAYGYSCSRKIVDPHSKFYKVSSTSFPMRQNLDKHPLDLKYMRSGSAYVEGIHRMKIKLDEPIGENETVVAYLNGFRFNSGPNHHEIGVTYSGFEVNIYNQGQRGNQDTELSPTLNKNRDEVTFYVNAKKFFGPELTRPATGIGRQNLFSYSAYASLDLSLAVISKDQKIQLKNNKDTHIVDFHLGFPDTDYAPLPRNCESEDKGLMGSHHITKFGYTIHGRDTKSNTTENMKARYLREIKLDLAKDGTIRSFFIDNTGEVTWKSFYNKYVETLSF